MSMSTLRILPEISPRLSDLSPCRDEVSSNRQHIATTLQCKTGTTRIKSTAGCTATRSKINRSNSRVLRRSRSRATLEVRTPRSDSDDDTTSDAISGSDSDSAVRDLNHNTDVSSVSLSLSKETEADNKQDALKQKLPSSNEYSEDYNQPPNRTGSRTAQEHEDLHSSIRSPTSPTLSLKYQQPTPPSGSPPTIGHSSLHHQGYASSKKLPPLDHTRLKIRDGSLTDLVNEDNDTKIRNEMLSHVDYFCTRNKQMANQILEVTAKNQELKFKLEILNKEKIELNKKVEDLDDQNNRFRNYNESLQESLLKIKNDCETLKQKEVNSWKKIKLLEEELIKSQEVQRVDQEKAEAALKDLEKTKDELRDMNFAIENYACKQQVSESETLKAVELERKRGQERELDHLGKIQRLEEKMFNYTKQNERLSNEVADLQKIKEEYKTLKDNLATEEKRYTALMIKFRDLKEDNQRLRQMRRGSLGADSESSSNDGVGHRRQNQSNTLNSTVGSHHGNESLHRIDLPAPTRLGPTAKKGRQNDHLPSLTK